MSCSRDDRADFSGLRPCSSLIVPLFLGETVDADEEKNFERYVKLERKWPRVNESSVPDTNLVFDRTDRAFANIFANSLAFLPVRNGMITITLDDIPSMLPPKGYDALLQTKHISLTIEDTGIGMSTEFLRKEYYRPMSKQVRWVLELDGLM